MEVAGLVLTVLPLCVKGLREIDDGTRRFMCYRRAVGRIVRQLEVESLKLENTCGNLLGDLVPADKLQQLLSGEGWKDTTFNLNIQNRLGPQGAEIFRRHMGSLESILRGLSKELGLNERFESELLDRETKKRLLKKLKFVSREGEYASLLAQIYQINADLAGLTMQQTRPNEVRLAKRTRRLPEAYNLVRQYTMHLHEIFQKRFQEPPFCTCAVAHVVNLRLQNIIDEQRQDTGAVRFKVVFSFDTGTATISRAPRDWCEAEFQPVRSSTLEAHSKSLLSPPPQLPAARGNKQARRRDRYKGAMKAMVSSIFGPSMQKQVQPRLTTSAESAPTATKKVSFGIPLLAESSEKPASMPEDFQQEIKSLCLKAEHLSRYSVGVLDPSCGRWHRTQPPITPPAAPYMADTVSLYELLSRGLLELASRLKLGFHLASAVVQLHGTEWLRESWCSQEILFFVRQDIQRRGADGSWFLDPIIDRPFVRQAFGGVYLSEQQGALAEPKLQVVDYDKSLFSLGIVLIELWFGRPFENLKSSLDVQNTAQTKSDSDHLAARYLTGRMIESGERYLLAVLRCLGLSRPTGSSTSSQSAARSLENPAYKSEVHETVVAVLEENYGIFINAIPDD